MALRDQPYLPLYVKDFTSDEKLRMCSAAAVGVYIFLLCTLHREQDYGKLHLRHEFAYTTAGQATQRAMDKESLYSAFADNLTRQMPFKAEVIKMALAELDYYGVVRFDGDTLLQPRMVRDGEISETRRQSVNKRWDPLRNRDRGAGSRQAATIQPTPAAGYRTATTGNPTGSQEGEKKAKRKPAFQPPTLEEIRAYCDERKNNVDPIGFFDFYTANGWVQGKQGKPVRDWKACVRTWERNGINNGRQKTGRGVGEDEEAAPVKKTRHTTLLY